MILVTGGTGFLGAELISQLLNEGKSVRAIKRDTSVIPDILKAETSIDWHEADILDHEALSDAMEGITRVYHCAAFVSFNKADKKLMHKINIEGTANLVNICLRNKVDKLLHVSSVSAVGASKQGRLISEENPWLFDRTQSNYAISKYESEMEVFRGIAEGLNAVIVNPSIIIGKSAGDSGSGQLFKKVRDHLSFYPSGSCGIVDVGDVVSIMIRLMESDISDERFILNSENLSYRRLFTLIADAYKLPAPNKKLTSWMLKSGYWLASLSKLVGGKDYGLTKEMVKSAKKEPAYSNQKITEALNFSFRGVEQSILEICQPAGAALTLEN